MEITRKLFGDVEVSTKDGDGILSRIEDVLGQLEIFYKTERIAAGDQLFENIQAVADETAALPGAEKISDYLRETGLHLEHVNNEPALERFAWSDQKLCDATLKIPGMITRDAMKYYKWLGDKTCGEGEAVELGIWMGQSTAAMLEGLAANPCFAGRRLHVFDKFQWDNWLNDYAQRLQLEFGPRVRRLLLALKPGDVYLETFLSFCSQHQELLEPHLGYLYVNGETGPLPPVKWTGKPVELLIHDLGNASETLAKIWEIFSPYFIPGKTIVVFYQYGHLRADKLRRFCREKANVLKPVHKPFAAAKGFRFTG